MNWPKARPDYVWPASCRKPAARLRAIAGDVAFHVAHAAGRVAAKLRPTPPSVCVIRTDGMGDAVLAEPAIRGLAQRFPGHDVHLWAPEATRTLFRAHPDLAKRRAVPRGYKAGNVSVLTSPRLRARLGYRLGRHRFDVAVYPAQSAEPLGHWLLASCRAAERWTHAGDLTNQHPCQRAKAQAAATRVLRPIHAADADEVARNAAVARCWGADVAEERPTVPLDLLAVRDAADVWADLDAWRTGFGASKLIALVIGGTAAVNRYPADKWADVLRAVRDEHDAAFAILADDDNRAEAEAVHAAAHGVPVRVVGPSRDPLALAALLGRFPLLLSVDTGPAHIAMAVGVPTIVLRGGGYGERFLPVWGEATVLTRPMPCAGCANRCTRASAECLTTIEPSEVIAAVRHRLGCPAIRLAA